MLDVLLKYVPPAAHSAYLGLLAQIPDYRVHVAVVGESCGAIGYLLKKRSGVRVAGATKHPRQAEVAAQILDNVLTDPADLSTILDADLDAILLCNLENGLEESLAWARSLIARLQPHGYIYALFGEPALAQIRGVSLAMLEGELTRQLGALGYAVYLRWPVVETDGAREIPRAVLIAAVVDTYNPIEHAAALWRDGLPVGAFHVLEQIPAPYIENPEAREAVGLAKLATLSDWIRLVRGHDSSALLGRALDQFYRLSDEWPLHPESYVAMAACWEAADDLDLAVRLLRSMSLAVPSEEVTRSLVELEARMPREAMAVDIVDPWDGTRPLRILYLINPRPHYGLDVLYDGLCDCLGDGQVVEFPWKPTLHGGETPEHQHYPCRFNRAGAPVSVGEICDALRMNAFDFILFGDVEGDIPDADVHAILAARGQCPLFLMDALDEFINLRPRVQARLAVPSFAGYFKREMHRCVDYGPDAWPVPFAYSGRLSLQESVAERPHPFFWAGHRRFGQRRLYLETLEKQFGWNLNVHYDQQAYQARIRESRMGLNCFGMGFDTVRYWELPAQGCMLLSDRLPIRIPHNFEDGVHAVFFGDLPELLEKLAYYLNRPEESRAVAEAGRLHFQQYHTNAARASQLLSRVNQILTSIPPRY